jgi:hypothetical protein
MGGTLYRSSRCKLVPERGGIGEQPISSLNMIKSLSALAIFGFLGTAVIALPGFAPHVEASETIALAKGDRLPVWRVDGNCSRQTWPNFQTSCLRNGDSGVMVREARLVTARR